MPAPKKPQDHLPKTTGVFTFEHEGEAYEIPSPTEALGRVSGRVLRDAAIGGEEGQSRLGFLLLESLPLADGVLDALYDKPAMETVQVIEAWLMSADQSGATLPKP